MSKRIPRKTGERKEAGRISNGQNVPKLLKVCLPRMTTTPDRKNLETTKRHIVSKVRDK